MKIRTVWLVNFLSVPLGIALEGWMFGWEDVRLRLESIYFLALIYSPFLIPAALIGLPVCGMIGLRVANRKLREPAEGFLLGILLGPLGVLSEATLPDAGLRARGLESRA